MQLGWIEIGGEGLGANNQLVTNYVREGNLGYGIGLTLLSQIRKQLLESHMKFLILRQELISTKFQ